MLFVIVLLCLSVISTTEGSLIRTKRSSTACATLWPDSNFEGKEFWVGLSKHRKLHNLNEEIANKISSVQVEPNCALDVYTQKNLKGKATTFIGNVNWVKDSFNDKISSFYCICW